MRLLLVEDDEMLGETLSNALRSAGYIVDWVKDGEIALSVLKHEQFHLAIMDLGLPKLDGTLVIQQIRHDKNDVPVLILTARDSVNDRVKGLDIGADDYLLKPFDLSELLARIRALLRRHQLVDHAIDLGPIRIDRSNFQIWFHGKLVSLSRREYTLLESFLSRPGQVFTRIQLEQMLYGWDEDVGSNTIEVHIHHIRKKFNNNIIRTVRGIGYVLPKEFLCS